jgi:hypothetical protein
MSDQGVGAREPDGAEEASEASAGEASEPSASTTREILEGGQRDWWTEEDLDSRQEALDTERKAMGPRLLDDEGEQDEGSRGGMPPPDDDGVSPIDEPGLPEELSG